MKKQSLHAALMDAGMTGEEAGKPVGGQDLRARLVRSRELVRSEAVDSLNDLIRAAAQFGDDPRFVPLRELAAIAERVMREYDSLAKMSLKDWACDVRATLEPWGGRDERYDLQTLRDFASMLHQRLAGPPDESRRLDYFFREYCEAERGCWLEEEEEAFLAEMETLWASLDELHESFPDLPLLLCLEFDEAKCLITRRIVREGVVAGRAALASHLVPLRTKLASVTDRMELIVAAGAVVRSGCTGRPLPAKLPQRVWRILEAVKASKGSLTGQELVEEKLGKSYNGSYKELLALMTGLGLLINTEGWGYSLPS